MAHHRFNHYITRLIASEINRFSTYYESAMQLLPLQNDSGALFEEIVCDEKEVLDDLSELKPLEETARRTLILNGNFNHGADIQELLTQLFDKIGRGDRVVAILCNPYFRWIYRVANMLRLREPDDRVTFVTNADLKNLAKLCNFETVRLRNVGYLPFSFYGIGDFINKIMPAIPLLRWLSFASVVVMRPVKQFESKPSLSIVIPARNESGNIENGLKRLPKMEGVDIEVIFVEGNSTDDTWEEIQRVVALEDYQHLNCLALQQPGKGKKDATMTGFDAATKDVVTVLDADLTMPPESLPRFYEAYRSGQADMVNGTRLMYPMEDEAMRFLNRLGNLFFAKALSNVLDISIGDSLCGTKLFSRRDHYRYLRWLNDFGDFDPFGDFQMLFPGAELCLGTVDVPVVYKARTYGSTNINRFRDGSILLKMTWQGFAKIKLGALPKS